MDFLCSDKIKMKLVFDEYGFHKDYVLPESWNILGCLIHRLTVDMVLLHDLGTDRLTWSIVLVIVRWPMDTEHWQTRMIHLRKMHLRI